MDLAAFPGRLRPFTIEAYDAAMLNYESGFSPEVDKFLRRDRRTFKDGRINIEGYNAADRARQVEARLAKADTGEALLSKAIESFVGRIQQMIAATDAGESWPPSEE